MKKRTLVIALLVVALTSQIAVAQQTYAGYVSSDGFTFAGKSPFGPPGTHVSFRHHSKKRHGHKAHHANASKSHGTRAKAKASTGKPKPNG
jgi:hypothetical protein